MTSLQVINPSNYEILGEVEVSTSAEVSAAVTRARAAQQSWWDLGLVGRIDALKAAFGEFTEHKEEFALLQSREVGMPITMALEDFDMSMDFADWYFTNAERLLAPVVTHESDTEIHTVVREPIGVIAAIVPWNFPLGNVIWNTLQSLIVGNVVVLKHSEECPLSGAFIERTLTKHLPIGVFNELYGDGIVGEQLANSDIDAISFTGSTRTGQRLYEIAARKLIKISLELGGSAPAVVWPDADLDTAADTIVTMRLLHSGQCCDGLKRLIVHNDVAETLLQLVIAKIESKKTGVATDSDTDLGPLVARRQLDLLTKQVNDALDKGAVVRTGGKSLEAALNGAFFEPTVLTGVDASMRVWNEEVFGPVLPVVTFVDDDEAVALANDTKFGLGAYLFTADSPRAALASRQIKSGMVSVNGVDYIRPSNPFGGYKKSGIGREHGQWGFEEVTQVKLIATNK